MEINIELVEHKDMFKRWRATFLKDGLSNVYTYVCKYHHIISCNLKQIDSLGNTVFISLNASLPKEVQQAQNRFQRLNPSQE
jgi:hypothetical protein